MKDFSILVVEGAFSSSVTVTLDLLQTASNLSKRYSVAAPKWGVYSTEGGLIKLRNGVCVDTQKLEPTDEPDNSTWVIPGLGLANPKEISERFVMPDAIAAANAVRNHVQQGGAVAASCSAVFLLQAAGLLKDRRVTTTWWLAGELKRLEPSCVVDADRMVMADGQITTAGAAFAQTDMMLHLLRVLCGNALTEAMSRALLIDGRQAQAPFIVPEAFANGDDLISRIAARIEAALPDLPKVGELASEFCMSERTLARHIQKATGKSTLALLQSVKQRRARALLESSRMTVEQVAAAVGYQDATALRRLMRRVAGANPSRFRPAQINQ
jgi:transcriptional regulator GlxA family with amidase domain